MSYNNWTTNTGSNLVTQAARLDYYKIAALHFGMIVCFLDVVYVADPHTRRPPSRCVNLNGLYRLLCRRPRLNTFPSAAAAGRSMTC